MLRATLKASVRKCSRNVRHNVRHQTTQASAPKKGRAGRKILAATGLFAAASGGTIAYAYLNPSFRTKVEEIIPQSKDVFDYAFGLGSTTAEKAINQIVDVKDRVANVLPFPRKTNEEEKSLLKVPPLPPIQTVSKSPAVVDPVDLKATQDSVIPDSKANAELKLKKNKEIEDALKAALSSATSKVQIATDAKVSTMAAISEHANLLKKTVDDGQNADWSKVTSALEKVEKLGRIDSAEETDARNYLDNIRKIVDDGRSCWSTRDNPLLANATETANKLGQQLDELNVMIQKSRNESRVMNQYKDLIEKSRRQFALELKSILPNVDIHAKDSKLTEDELNALIAHAHLRVDQLRRQLMEQQVREEQNIAKAIEQQRQADAKFAQDQLQLEIKRVKEQSDVDLDRKVISSRKEWEHELEERLRRAAAAHSEHLEQVVRTQRQLYDIEQNQKIEEAIAQERSLHSRQISVAQGRLEGIETALNSRIAADVENRRSKQFWIACQNLVDSVTHGRKGGADLETRRKPLANELQVIKEASFGDEFVTCLLNALPNESIYNGVYTEQDLKTRFLKLYKTGRRVAKVDDNGGGLMRYFLSYLQNAVTLDLMRKFSPEDKLDPLALDTYEIFARAKYFVDGDDLGSAVRVMQLLQGEAGRLARDWIADVRAHLETRFIAELLVAHAAVSSIRAIY